MPQRIRKTIKGAPAGIVILFFILIALTDCRGREYPYTIQTFRSSQGWGYDILLNDKVYIHQPNIPAVEGQVPFNSKKSAEQTARLMVKKLKEHKVPSVTKEELEKIITP